MKRLHIISIITAIALLTGISGCTERIDINLEDSYTRLVVEGYFTTDTTAHTVKLTKTADYFSNEEAPPVSNALVTINDTIKLQENPEKPGFYHTAPDVYGKEGKTYQLKIKNVDIDNNGQDETYTANTHLNPLGKADSINLVYRKYTDEVQFWEIRAYAQDPETKNYYVFKVLKNDTLVTDTLNECMVQEDELFNGNYINGVTVQFLDDSKKSEKLRKNDTITLEINSVTEGYFRFFNEILSETRPSVPLFSGPPANITTNVRTQNGPDAVGYFSGYSITRVSTVVKNPKKKKQAALEH